MAQLDEAAAEKAVSGWRFYATKPIAPSVSGWEDCWPRIDPRPSDPSGKGEDAIARWAYGRGGEIDASRLRYWVDNDRPDARKAAFVEAVRQEITPHLPQHWGVEKYGQHDCFLPRSMAETPVKSRDSRLTPQPESSGAATPTPPGVPGRRYR